MRNHKFRSKIVNLQRSLFVSGAVSFALLIILIHVSGMLHDFRLGKNQQPEGKQNEEVGYAEKLVDPIAIFTLALVVSTVLLWRSTERLAALASRQARDSGEALRIATISADAAANTAKALLASEKPYVKEIINNFDFLEVFKGGFYDNSPSMPSSNCSMYLWYSFKNYGKTPAEIIEYSMGLKIEAHQPFVSTTGGKAIVVNDFGLQEPTLAAQAQTDPIPQTFREEISWVMSRELITKQKYIWLVGWVAWIDVFENKTFRYFTWRYDHARKLFVPRNPILSTRDGPYQGPG